MKLEISLKACHAVPLDEILGSSVVLNWSFLGLATSVGTVSNRISRREQRLCGIPESLDLHG